MNRPPDCPLSRAAARELAQARDWARLATAADGCDPNDPAVEPETIVFIADALWRVGRAEEAGAFGRAVEERIRTNGDERLLFNVCNIIGIAEFQLGALDRAEDRFGELLDRASERGDHEYAARASNNLGVIASIRGRRDAALAAYERALAAYQQLGYLRGLAQIHQNLAIAYRDLGVADGADRHFLRAIDFATRAQSPDVVALAEIERAVLLTRTGDIDLAGSLAQRALDHFTRADDPSGRGEALRALAAVARARNDLPTAVELLDGAVQLASEHSLRLLEAECLRDRGLALSALGRTDAARASLERAAARFDLLGAASEAAACRDHAAALPGGLS